MNESRHALETNQLTKTFGDFTAVNNLSLSIPKGEIFGLLGPNGAGKTTTIRMLCGIMKPSSGSAQVLGFDCAKESEQIKKNIGYMSQKFSLYNDLTAAENIRFYASLYGVPRQKRHNRVLELIEMAGLKHQANQLTRNLSGAWRQRLALVCAIAHEPQMVFLDEATAGVDPVSRREFWDLIYRMAGNGVSVLATTHYMDEAEYCNTVGMMYRGELIAVASPDAMKENLHGILFQIDCERPEDAAPLLEEAENTKDVVIHGNMLHVIVPETAAATSIKKILVKNGFRVDTIERIQPSLEDVFISMVQQRQVSDTPASSTSGFQGV